MTELEKLIFRPIARCRDGRLGWLGEEEEEMDKRACATLNALLRKCSDHLEELEVRRDSALIWPMFTSASYAQPAPLSTSWSQDVVPLPELKRIVLGGTQADDHALSKLLVRSPKLHYFQLEEIIGIPDMRTLLTAIRDHPSRMTLKWDQVCVATTDFSACYNTAHASSAKKVKVDFDSRADHEVAYTMELERSLQNYVAGKGRWNKSLWMEFQGGATGIEYSDDEEAQS